MFGWVEGRDVDVGCSHEHFLRNAPRSNKSKPFSDELIGPANVPTSTGNGRWGPARGGSNRRRLPTSAAEREVYPPEIYRPNSLSISQPSSPAAASGRTDEVRVGAGLATPFAGSGAAGADAEGVLTCEAV